MIDHSKHLFLEDHFGVVHENAQTVLIKLLKENLINYNFPIFYYKSFDFYFNRNNISMLFYYITYTYGL